MKSNFEETKKKLKEIKELGLLTEYEYEEKLKLAKNNSEESHKVDLKELTVEEEKIIIREEIKKLNEETIFLEEQPKKELFYNEELSIENNSKEMKENKTNSSENLNFKETSENKDFKENFNQEINENKNNFIDININQINEEVVEEEPKRKSNQLNFLKINEFNSNGINLKNEKLGNLIWINIIKISKTLILGLEDELKDQKINKETTELYKQTKKLLETSKNIQKNIFKHASKKNFEINQSEISDFLLYFDFELRGILLTILHLFNQIINRINIQQKNRKSFYYTFINNTNYVKENLQIFESFIKKMDVLDELFQYYVSLEKENETPFFSVMLEKVIKTCNLEVSEFIIRPGLENTTNYDLFLNKLINEAATDLKLKQGNALKSISSYYYSVYYNVYKNEAKSEIINKYNQNEDIEKSKLIS
jgi:hypothetical protein